MSLGVPRPLARRDRTDRFDSGRPELDDWLRRYARMATAAGTAQTYVAVGDRDEVCAYYALSPASVIRGDAPARFAQGVPAVFGVVLLARLAVDRRHQGAGLGSALVADAARHTLAAAELIGARAMVVHAADAAAVRFYERLSFVAFPSNPQHLGILVKDLRSHYGG